MSIEQNKPSTKTPHAGSEAMPPELRELPHDEAAIISPDHVGQPIGDKMPYTDEERALAREVQAKVAPTKERTKKSPLVKAGLALGGLAAVGAAVFGGTKALGGEANTEPRQEPNASAPANPGETEPGGPAAYDFGIPAAEYQNDPQALGNKFYEQFNEYLAAGASEDEAHSDDRYKMKDAEYVDSISEDVDQTFTDDLFVSGWENDPELASMVQSFIDVAHETRIGRLVTYPVGTEEEVPYIREYVIDEAGGTTNPLVTNTRWHVQDNRHENNVEEKLTGDDPNDDTGGDTITWVEENGELKISSIDYNEG